MSKEEFEKEEKECAEMCGMTLEEYRNSLKNRKITEFDDEKETDEELFKRLGVKRIVLKKKELK